MPRALFTIIASALLSGCASALYDWNMKHAYVAPRAHLSPAEVEQIIRAVTQKSLSVIIGMSRFSETGKPDEVTVYTELDPSSSLMMVYDLHKGSDGLWHVVDHGEGTIIVY
jgi:hypothetical protein